MTTTIANDSAPETSPPATAVATRAQLPVARAAGGVIPWDPFALMDRLDADTFIAEMQGIASDVLVYAIKDGGKETIGLSKGGVDECCTMLVSQGQCIREENLKFEFFGEGEDKEAWFTVTAARFAVHSDGREVRLDQVLGVKREPLYEARASLTPDSKVAGKKWRHLTYAQAIEDEHAVEYLEWIRDASSFDDDTKRFVTLLLDGADVREFAMGKRFNNFWFEHGAMKAARNARFRLIPAGLKVQVVAMATQARGGKVKVVERAETSDAQPMRAATKPARAAKTESAKTNGGDASTAPQMDDANANASAAHEPGPVVSRRQPSTSGYRFPFAPRRGVLLDTLKVDDATGEVVGYVVSDELVRRALGWASDCLAGKAFERAGAPGEKKPIETTERPKFEAMQRAMEHELEARSEEAHEAAEARAAKIPGGDGEGEQRADPTPVAAAGRSTASQAADATAALSPAVDGTTTTATPTTGATSSATTERSTVLRVPLTPGQTLGSVLDETESADPLDSVDDGDDEPLPF
jgi:hypothetical protein